MVVSGAETVTDTLPDGSVVVLNKKSTISYPQNFTGNTREVSMTGEAFFEVHFVLHFFLGTPFKSL